MFGELKRFSPFGLIVGYLTFYYFTKGLDRILPDLTGITIEKLMSKTTQWTIIAGAALGLYAIRYIRLPASIKAIITLVLYFLIGYNFATAIDPPIVTYMNRGAVRYVPPRSLNPYAGV